MSHCRLPFARSLLLPAVPHLQHHVTQFRLHPLFLHPPGPTTPSRPLLLFSSAGAVSRRHKVSKTNDINNLLPTSPIPSPSPPPHRPGAAPPMDALYLARDFAAFVARRGIRIQPPHAPAVPNATGEAPGARRRPREEAEEGWGQWAAPGAKRPRTGAGEGLAGYAGTGDSGIAAYAGQNFGGPAFAAGGSAGYDYAGHIAGSAASYGYGSAERGVHVHDYAGSGEAGNMGGSTSAGITASAATTGSLGFSCVVCGRTFSRKGVLKKHVEAVHDGVRSFSCDHCDACFGLKSDLYVSPQMSAASWRRRY